MKKLSLPLFLFISVSLLMTSCISKKQHALLQSEYDAANTQIGKCGEDLNDYMQRLAACEKQNAGDVSKLRGQLQTAESNLRLREEQIKDLKDQIGDIRGVRDKQVTQLDDLTSLSQSANDNIKETLSQLENKDK